jgi:Pentapeptide repeats (8 copies)
MTTLAIIAAVVGALVVVGLAIWLIPRWQVDRWRRAGISDEVKLAELGVQARSSITQALGGLAIIVTIAITAFQVNEARRSSDRAQESADKNFDLAQQSAARNFELAQRGQVSERFSRAVEQLGAMDENDKPDPAVRTGALFSLMRIGIDSPDHTQPALLVVATYVRKFKKPKLQPNGCDADFNFTQAQPDIANALRFVLYRIAAKLKDKAEFLGLRGADLDGLALDGLNLRGFDLTRIKFGHASLRRADFRGAILGQANFEHTCLTEADFRGASLKGAVFRGATLDGAKFTREDLSRAPLSKEQKRQVVVVP